MIYSSNNHVHGLDDTLTSIYHSLVHVYYDTRTSIYRSLIQVHKCDGIVQKYYFAIAEETQMASRLFSFRSLLLVFLNWFNKL